MGKETIRDLEPRSRLRFMRICLEKWEEKFKENKISTTNEDGTKPKKRIFKQNEFMIAVEKRHFVIVLQEITTIIDDEPKLRDVKSEPNRRI